MEVKPYSESSDSKKTQVAMMFNNIAHRYDFLNGKMVRLIKRRNSIFIGVTILFSLSFCFSLRAQSSEIVGVGDKIPNFEFVLDGVKLDESYFTHKLVWINFFATWCPPCRAELKLINEKLNKKYKDNCDFAFIS